MYDVAAEIRRRIKVSVWAYAYEILNDPLVDDSTFDIEIKKIKPWWFTSYNTKDNNEIDAWFLKNFIPYTGMWIWNHPNKARLFEYYLLWKENKMNDRGLVIPFIKKQEEEENMLEGKLLTGGKGPSDSTNWLENLEIGTIFLIEDRQSADFNLGHFKLVDKTEKACILASSVLPQPVFVNSFRFCQKYRLFEDLGTIKEEEDTKVLKDPKEEALVLSEYLIKKEEDIKKE